MIKFALLIAAVQSLAPVAGKKFISLGWEFIYTPPSVIAEHADSYRGCGLSGANFTLYGTLADGTKVCSNRIAEDKPWTREAFAAGALRAAQWAAGRAPGLYTMRDVLGFTNS